MERSGILNKPRNEVELFEYIGLSLKITQWKSLNYRIGSRSNILIRSFSVYFLLIIGAFLSQLYSKTIHVNF